MGDFYGEKFLDKIYNSLYRCNSSGNPKGNNKYFQIRKELERLQELYDEDRNSFYEMYYDKYIIKEFYLAKKLDREEIINAQKNSLKNWLDELFDSFRDYPIWARYYLLRGVVKTGCYDETKKTYTKRIARTLNPFIDANPYVIQKCLDHVIKMVKQDRYKIEGFKEIYIRYETEYINSIMNGNYNIGIWKKYNQGSRKDASMLANDLTSKNTHWCISSEAWCVGYLCGKGSTERFLDGYNGFFDGGDLYVYYTMDKNGEYTVPRIAIRLIGHDRIDQVRGIEKYQELETIMLNPLEEKINSMDFLKESGKEEVLNRINNIRNLIELERKLINSETIESEELIKYFTSSYGFGKSEHFIYDRISRLLKNNRHLVDRDVILKTISVTDRALEYATEDLLSEYLLMVASVRLNVDTLKYIPEDGLRDDPEFMLIAIESNHYAIRFISNNLKNNKEFIQRASEIYCFAVEYASDNIKKELKKIYDFK